MLIKVYRHMKMFSVFESRSNTLDKDGYM